MAGSKSVPSGLVSLQVKDLGGGFGGFGFEKSSSQLSAVESGFGPSDVHSFKRILIALFHVASQTKLRKYDMSNDVPPVFLILPCPKETFKVFLASCSIDSAS